jgi:hypothetical protein
VPISPQQKLTANIVRMARYMAIEWDFNVHETVGCIELAKLELWNEWESAIELPNPEEEEPDD